MLVKIRIAMLITSRKSTPKLIARSRRRESAMNAPERAASPVPHDQPPVLVRVQHPAAAETT